MGKSFLQNRVPMNVCYRTLQFTRNLLKLIMKFIKRRKNCCRKHEFQYRVCDHLHSLFETILKTMQEFNEEIQKNCLNV
jgi:hypothetical protein